MKVEQLGKMCKKKLTHRTKVGKIWNHTREQEFGELYDGIIGGGSWLSFRYSNAGRSDQRASETVDHGRAKREVRASD